MNPIYRLIWNDRHNAFFLPSPSGRGDGGEGKAHRQATVALLSLLLAATFAQAGDIAPDALPAGGQVAAGQATVQQANARMDITQTSDKAILNWQSYNIGQNAQVNYNQPSASAVSLNRVVGEDPSQILGRLSANGQVFLVNPNGIYFGKNAQIDVAGLVATTHNIRDQDFMAGRYDFNIPGRPGAAVINEGGIRIADTGIAAFVAPSVANRGVIAAKLGKVQLAAANGFTLDFQGDDLLSFLVDDKVAQTALDQNGQPLGSFVENSGRIQAQGGKVWLTAKAAEGAVHSAINHSGVVEATTVENRKGKIILHAGEGSLAVTGKLDASAPQGGDGGFIETSGGEVNIDPGAEITTAAPNGKTGDWLIDPNDYTIAAAGGNITGATLSANLGTNNVTIQTATHGTHGGNGDIFVNDPVSWSANTTLSLQAQRDIRIVANISATGSTAGLILGYGTGRDYYISNSYKVTLSGNDPLLKIGVSGSEDTYTVINRLGVAGDMSSVTLQGINNNLSGKYALGASIDALPTTSWNAGAGFTPIGQDGDQFVGALHGLGNDIANLTINSPIAAWSANYVGLFGSTGAQSQIRDISLSSARITGYAGGILVGRNLGKVDHANTSGALIAVDGSGGLMGGSNGVVSNSSSSALITIVGSGTVPGSGVGGLIGNNNGSIDSSYFSGSISAPDHDRVGGLVGAQTGTINNSYSIGTVTGRNVVGGLAGLTAGTINSSYSAGLVTGSVATGGLLGSAGGVTGNSYWNTQTSGQASSAGGTGKTSAEMKQQATFSGWDFTNVWTIQEGISYPTLRMASSAPTSTLFSEEKKPDPNNRDKEGLVVINDPCKKTPSMCGSPETGKGPLDSGSDPNNHPQPEPPASIGEALKRGDPANAVKDYLLSKGVQLTVSVILGKVADVLINDVAGSTLVEWINPRSVEQFMGFFHAFLEDTDKLKRITNGVGSAAEGVILDVISTAIADEIKARIPDTDNLFYSVGKELGVEAVMAAIKNAVTATKAGAGYALAWQVGFACDMTGLALEKNVKAFMEAGVLLNEEDKLNKSFLNGALISFGAYERANVMMSIVSDSNASEKDKTLYAEKSAELRRIADKRLNEVAEAFLSYYARRGDSILLEDKYPALKTSDARAVIDVVYQIKKSIDSGQSARLDINGKATDAGRLVHYLLFTTPDVKWQNDNKVKNERYQMLRSLMATFVARSDVPVYEHGRDMELYLEKIL